MLCAWHYHILVGKRYILAKDITVKLTSGLCQVVNMSYIEPNKQVTLQHTISLRWEPYLTSGGRWNKEQLTNKSPPETTLEEIPSAVYL